MLKKALELALASDLSTKEVKLKLASMFGVDNRTAARILINAKNELNKAKVKNAKKKILFLPQCLRARDCRAKLTDDGYACAGCRPASKCLVAKILGLSDVSTYVMPGGALVTKIIQRENPTGVIGVACVPELEEGASFCERQRIPAVGVPLAVDGCIETVVDFAEVEKILREVKALKKNSRRPRQPLPQRRRGSQ